VVLVFVPVLVGIIALIGIHRRARHHGEDPPLAVAVLTGTVLGLILAEVSLMVVAIVAHLIV